MESSDTPKERTILVGVGLRYGEGSYGTDPLEELRLLAETAGATVVGKLVQRTKDIESTYYIGTGKAQELKELVLETNADMVVFDNDLSPAQVSNLQELLEVKVVERSGLILDIFALRARTRQARTQVELAQLKYMLPRLTRQWTHLSRQQGGIGTRGPGETQLEVDRRAIRTRIRSLTHTLEKIDRARTTGRNKRQNMFKVALVGYTNAGKSTLLNAISGAGVPVEDKLFKTLDSVTRLVQFDAGPSLLISDTVGFIRNLPHHLVASFTSTLDEVREADLLLHVVDITNPEWEDQIVVVNGVLADLDVRETETIIVFNKADRAESAALAGVAGRFPTGAVVSGVTGEGIPALEGMLVAAARRHRITWSVLLDPSDGDLVQLIYRNGTVLESTSEGSFLRIVFSMDPVTAGKLRMQERLGSRITT